MKFRWKLDRPLAVFDIESTGVNPRVDRIIDLAVVTLQPGKQQTTTFRVDPGRPIPPDATAVHGITDEDVKGCPRFEEIAADVVALLEGSDLAGFNIIRYDLPLLREEFKRAQADFAVEGRRLIDAQRIFHGREPRDLSAALRFYRGEMHLSAHGAADDALATLRVLEGQFERYPDLPRDLDALHEYCNPRDPSWVDQTGKLKWVGDEAIVNFGKHQGRSLRELTAEEPGFLQWVLRKDFPEDTQDIVRKALAGNFPRPDGDASAQ